MQDRGVVADAIAFMVHNHQHPTPGDENSLQKDPVLDSNVRYSARPTEASPAKTKLVRRCCCC